MSSYRESNRRLRKFPLIVEYIKACGPVDMLICTSTCLLTKYAFLPLSDLTKKDMAACPAMVLTPSLEIPSTESEITPPYPQHSLPADRRRVFCDHPWSALRGWASAGRRCGCHTKLKQSSKPLPCYSYLLPKFEQRAPSAGSDAILPAFTSVCLSC